MVNFEWPHIFPRSRMNLPFVVSFIFLGDIGETKLIREATLKLILRYGLDMLRSQLNLGSVKCL